MSERFVKYWDVKNRRDSLRELGLCINGPMELGKPSRNTGLVHGPVVQSGKCARCLEVHRRTR